MFKKRSVSMVIATLLLAALIATPALPTSAAEMTNNNPDVVVVSSDDRNTYFPTVEKLQNGDLVVVYYDSPGHISQTGRISMVRSSDNGETWSEPQVILDTPIDDRDPNIMQTDDGTLLLSYFAYDWGQNPAKVIGTYVTRSEDGGTTWSEPVKVGTMLDGPSVPGWAATSDKILELDNGDLLIPLYGTVPGDSAERVTVVRSTDGGESWKKENEVAIAYDPDIHFQEPALAKLGNGHLMIMMRTARTDGSAYVSESYDNGYTWTEPTKTDMMAQASDMLVLKQGGPKGMIFHTWGDVSGEYSSGRPVVGTIKFYNKDWSFHEPALIYSGGCGDESYPSSVQLDDGRLFTVYYDACAGYIGGTYSHLSDYIGNKGKPPKKDHKRGQLDLWRMYVDGKIQISTNMNWTDPRYPNMQPWGAIDGNPTYWHAASIDRDAPPSAYYILELDQLYNLSEVGVVLKPGYKESANIYLSEDGVDWGEPIAALEGIQTDDFEWIELKPSQSAKYVKVEINDSYSNWAQLTEISLVTSD